MAQAPLTQTWHYYSPAKLNLSLRVTKRRSDGLHDLCSLFAYCGWYDVLQLTRVDGQNSITVDMDGPHAPQDVMAHDNLAVRAYHFAVQNFGDLPAVSLQLTKNIPVGAGLGGGSGNAAAILRWALAQKNIPLPLADNPIVPQIRAALGADTYPIFEGQARIWTGTGDQPGPALALSPANPLYVLVVFPQEHLATRKIFGAMDSFASQLDPRASLMDELREGPNSLQDPAASLSGPVAQLLEAMKLACQSTYSAADDALKVQMSGSGSACFAIFTSKERAREAAQHPHLVSLPQYVGPLMTSAWENSENQGHAAHVTKV